MNIFSFKIHIKSKEQQANLEEIILCKFKANSSKASEYDKYVCEEWDKIKESRVKTLYTKKSLKAIIIENHTKYFLINNQVNDSRKSINYEVLVLSDAEKINDSVNTVYRSLKETLKGLKFGISNDKALLYIYDKNDNDVYSTEVTLKAFVIGYSKMNKREMGRAILIGILGFVFFVARIMNISDAVNNVMYSLIAACIFWIVSEAVVKISFAKQIEVNDLSNCFECNKKLDILGDKNVEFEVPKIPKVPQVD